MKNIRDKNTCKKCKYCCYFPLDERIMAPYFVDGEINKVDKKGLLKNGKYYQSKLVKVKLSKDMYRCYFLDEKKYSCKIYSKRPMDCITWPFVVGWDKQRKGVFLWVMNKKTCALSPSAKKMNEKKYVDNIIKYLERNKYIEQMENGLRPIWHFANGQIKLKKLM